MGEIIQLDCDLCPSKGSSDYDLLCSEAGFGLYGQVVVMGGYAYEVIFLVTRHFLQDIDECAAMGDELCSDGQCVNTMGSYRCICDRGFKVV